MLAPKRMSKMLIAASRDQLPVVVAELYRRRLFHIEEFVDSGAEGYEGFKIGSPLPGASEASVDLVKIRSIENVIAVNTDDAGSQGANSRSSLKARIEWELPAIERDVEELSNKRSKLETEAKDLEQRIVELTPFADVPFELGLLRGYKEFTVFAGYIARDVTFAINAVRLKRYCRMHRSSRSRSPWNPVQRSQKSRKIPKGLGRSQRMSRVLMRSLPRSGGNIRISSLPAKSS